MTKKTDPKQRLSPNQKGPKISKVENAPKIDDLQNKIEALEDHIRLTHANKLTETEGLKQLLLESAECSPTKDDSIDIMMEKEKQKKEISDKIQHALTEIDQINTRLKTSKMEQEEFNKQLTDIKIDITTIKQDMLEDQHHLLKQKNQLNILQH